MDIARKNSLDLKWRPFSALLLLMLALFPGIGEFVRPLMFDVMAEIVPFVALALGLVYGAESWARRGGHDIWSNTKSWHIPLAVLLGAMPGCGGAVAVVVAHASGKVSFGVMVAALTATAGDAAFVLMIGAPEIFALVLSLQVFAGLVTGYVVDALRWSPGRSFLQEEGKDLSTRPRDVSFLVSLLPLFVVGFLGLVGFEIPEFWIVPMEFCAVFSAALGLLIFSVSTRPVASKATDSLSVRVSEETSFILFWLLLAALVVEGLISGLGLEPSAWFTQVMWLAPIFGMGIGLIPGYGPQVALVTLFLAGQAPLAAVAANVVSNDGDALFPALVKSPSAAALATAASVPASLLVGYLVLFFTMN